MAIYARHLLLHMDVFGKPRRLGEIPAQVAVAPPAFHGPGVADEGAPAGSGAVHRRRDTAEGVRAPLTGRRIVTVEAACVAEVAGLLLRNGLVVGDGLVDLVDDL